MPGILTTQPRNFLRGNIRIDWSHPVTRGLFDCFLWHDSFPVNLVTGQYGTLVGSPSNRLTMAGPGKESSGGSGYSFPDHGNTAAGDFTFRCLFYAQTYPNDFASMLDKSTGSGAVNNEFLILFASNGQIDWLVIGGTQVVSVNPGICPVKQVNDCVITRTGSSVKAYNNGTLNGGTLATGGTTAKAGSLYKFGPITDTGGSFDNFTYIAAQFWSRGLSADEVAYLYSNPYAFLTTAEYEMPALNAGPSFIAGWSRQSNLPVIGGGTF